MSGRSVREAETFTLDGEGRPDGFQVGKAAAMLDWQFKKENAGFDQLCRRLYARNWARKERARNPEKVRARLRAWRERHRDVLNAQARERDARKRVTRYIVCDVCLAVVPATRRKRFCGMRCRNRWTGVPRARARCRGLRNMTITPEILAVLVTAPREGFTLREICARAPALKLQSVATLLVELRKRGRIAKHGTCGGKGAGKRVSRYTLAAATGRGAR